MSSMNNLLKQGDVKVPAIGEKIEGTIIDIGTNAVYVDLGSFGTGVIWSPELDYGGGAKKRLHVGDVVYAVVLDLENEDGYVELSLKQASKEQVWDDIREKMQKGEVVNARVMDANKGGLIIEVSGVQGFLPVSQLALSHYPRVEGGDKNKILSKLKDYVGQDFSVKIISISEEEEQIVVSEKAAVFNQEAFKGIKPGDIIEGEVSGVVDFGAFMKFGENLEGLIHISELAWQLIENPREVIKVGDKVNAKVMSIDNDKISLSIKALKEDPWNEADKKYKIGDEVQGEVTKINNFGAFVQLDKDIHGLVHVSEMRKDEEGKPALEVGEKYTFKILTLEPKEHRLSLKIV